MTITYYGAYGANLNKEEMQVRCPAAKPIESLLLVDWTLVFKGVADMIPDAGSAILIGIYEITETCERALDHYEGYPWLYKKHYLNVALSRGPTQIMTYVMQEHYDFGKPASKYFQIIDQGYDDWEFDHALLNTALRHSIQNDRGDSYKSPRWED